MTGLLLRPCFVGPDVSLYSVVLDADLKIINQLNCIIVTTCICFTESVSLEI